MIESFRRAAEALAIRHVEPAAATSLQTRRLPLARNLMDGDIPSRGKTDEQLAAFRGTIYAAVDKIGRRIQQIPLKLIGVTIDASGEQERVGVHSHPFLSLLGPGSRARPHEEWSVRELFYWTTTSLDLTGEAWWICERNILGVPARITPVAANRMSIVLMQETGLIAGFVFLPLGAHRDESIFIPKLPFDELFQPANLTLPFVTFFRYPSPRGFEDPRGWSPVKAAALSYDINLFELIYKKTFLEHGAQLGGILQTSILMTQEQIDEYLEQFKTRHRGPDKAGLPLILPPSLQWHQTEPTPRDLQWAETVALTDQQILQIYGVSDAKLGRADIGNRATAEAMDAAFNKEVVQSRLDTIQSKLDSDFIPIYPGQTDLRHFDVEFGDPVPADSLLELKREEMDVRNRIRTRDEIRADRGEDPMGRYGELVEVPMGVDLVDPVTAESVLEPEMDDDGDGHDDDDDDGDGGGGLPFSLAVASGGRAVQRAEDPRITEILQLLLSPTVRDRFVRGTRPIILSVLDDEVKIAFSLAGGVGAAEVVTVHAEWLSHFSRRIGGINRVTASQLRLTLLQGLELGEGTADLFARAEGIFAGRLGFDVERIARTEVIGASNFGSFRGMREAGAPFKEWITNLDGLQRPTHDKANGAIVEIDQTFRVGDSGLMYPGDPGGSAEEVIHCRCNMAPAFKAKKSAFTTDQREAIWRTFDQRTQRAERRLKPRIRRELHRQRTAVLAIIEAA